MNEEPSGTFLIGQRARALLKRTDPFEVRDAYDWAHKLRKLDDFSEVEVNRLVALAPLAAIVREDLPTSLGKLMRREEINERHVRRLLESDRDDINEQLARMVQLLGRKANIPDLIATSIYRGERKRRQVATDYFGARDEEESAGV